MGKDKNKEKRDVSVDDKLAMMGCSNAFTRWTALTMFKRLKDPKYIPDELEALEMKDKIVNAYVLVGFIVAGVVAGLIVLTIYLISLRQRFEATGFYYDKEGNKREMKIQYEYVQGDRTKVMGSGEDYTGKFVIQGESSADPFKGVERSTLKLVATYPNKTTHTYTGELQTKQQSETWMNNKEYLSNVSKFYGTWHDGVNQTDTRGFELQFN